MAKNTPSNGTIKAQAVAIGPENELLELLPKIMLFPGEDQTTYNGLHAAFMSDLSPTTPYEAVIVENLVTLEWEAMRHRRIRDDLIRIEYRKYATGAFMTKKIETTLFGEESAEATKFVKALMGADPAPRAESLKTLEEIGINEGEILAKAYEAASQYVEIHEGKLAELEIRRRRLREDHDRLRAALAIPVMAPEVADAIVLDEV
jgi:hypothetical protein